MTRILITGASGLLGSNLAIEWSKIDKTDEIYGLFLNNRPELPRVVPAACNLLDAEGLQRLLGEIRPEVVVHAAAMTGVDTCETDPAVAWAVNVQGTCNLMQACPPETRHLIYISTDYVFSGLRGHYTEADAPSPVNVYGRTKLDGERMIMAAPVPWTIVRTSFFGWSPGVGSGGSAGGAGSGSGGLVRRCFMEQSLASLESGNAVNAWTNRFSTPLLVNDLAQVLIEIAHLGLTGLWHAGSEERVSNWQLLRYLSEHLGKGAQGAAAEGATEGTTMGTTDLIIGGAFQSQPGLGRAERPFDTSLCSYRLQAALRRSFGDYRQAVRRWLDLRNSGYIFAVR